MKSIRYSLYLFTSLIVVHCVSTINQHNTFNFERAEMKVVPNTGLKLLKFLAKKVNHTAMDVDVEVSVNRTYQSLFVHIVVYRQFSTNEFRKFLVDVWEDICKVMDGANGNVLLTILKRQMRGYNNIFRECPYPPDIYYFKIKSMLIDTMNFGQILPSGRYRIELTGANAYEGTTLMIGRIYVSISDQRLEQF